MKLYSNSVVRIQSMSTKVPVNLVTLPYVCLPRFRLQLLVGSTAYCLFQFFSLPSSFPLPFLSLWLVREKWKSLSLLSFNLILLLKLGPKGKIRSKSKPGQYYALFLQEKRFVGFSNRICPLLHWFPCRLSLSKLDPAQGHGNYVSL